MIKLSKALEKMYDLNHILRRLNDVTAKVEDWKKLKQSLRNSIEIISLF
jgi:DNA mismatch repair ATPase MutS